MKAKLIMAGVLVLVLAALIVAAHKVDFMGMMRTMHGG
jgi:hypothetical protein